MLCLSGNYTGLGTADDSHGSIHHEPVEHLVLSLNQTLQDVLATVLTIYVTSDMALSFKAALDIRTMLERMTKVKEEMEKVQGRLDAIIAFAGPRISQEAERFQAKYRVNEILQDIKTTIGYSAA